MKVITVLGTRPEIIRLSRIIPKLDNFCEHIVIHTGQNYDEKLSDIFFEQLNIRKPNYFLNSKAHNLSEQISKILIGCEEIFQKEKPDRMLILGDTNSALCAIIAKRMGITVYHMEAGNRCYDDRVPEEVNRRIIDHSSDLLLPYTYHSRDHLLREGFHPSQILVTGNPINEVINHYMPQIEKSEICNRLNVKRNNFFLVTLHRSENVDNPDRLTRFLNGLLAIYEKYHLPVLMSLHPRTRSRIEIAGTIVNAGINFLIL
jgi:UDP-N-acetylglucosamine 2-epimerase (non-hydrolysing)